MEEEYTIEISQVVIQRVMKRDGKRVAAAETLLRPCCPSRFRTAFGVEGEDLEGIVNEDADIRDFVWPPDEE